MFGWRRPAGEVAAMPETRKRARFEIRSRLLLSVLAGFSLMKEPAAYLHAPDNVDLFDAGADWEPPEHPITFPKKEVDRVFGTETFEFLFSEELAHPIPAEMFSSFIDKIFRGDVAVQTQNILQGRDRFEAFSRFTLEGVRSTVSSEQDLRDFFHELDAYKEKLPTDQDSHERKYCEQLAIRALCARGAFVPVYTVRDVDDLISFARYADSGFLNEIVGAYEFPSLPHIVSQKTLPDILHIFRTLLKNAARTTEAGLAPSYLADIYRDSLEFDPSEFPHTISYGDEKVAMEAASKLQNAVMYYRSGIEKPDPTVDNDIRSSFGLGSAYLATVSLEGYPTLDVSSVKEVIAALEKIKTAQKYVRIQKDVNTWDFHSLAQDFSDRYLSLYGRAAVESLSLPQAVEKARKMAGEIYSENERLWQEEKFLSFFVKPFRASLSVERAFTEENFQRLLSLVKSELPSATLAGEDRISHILFTHARFPQKVVLSKEDVVTARKTLSGRALLTSLVNYVKSGITQVELHGYSHEVTDADTWRAAEEDLMEITELFHTDFLKLPINLQYSSKDVRWRNTWQHPSSYESLVPLYRLVLNEELDNSAILHVLAEQMDVTALPLFSIRHIPEEVLTVPFMIRKRLFERAEFPDTLFTVTSTTLDEVARMFIGISNQFGTSCAHQYLNALRFPGFPATLEDASVIDISAALTLLENKIGRSASDVYARSLKGTSLRFHYARVITDENLEQELSKRKLVDYNLGEPDETQKLDIHVTAPVPTNMQEFMQAMVKLGMVQKLDQEVAYILQEEMLQKIDWSVLAQGSAFGSIEEVEKMRLAINEAAQSTQGDRVVVMIGTMRIDRAPVEWENLNEKVTFAEMYLQSSKYVSVDQDVEGLYRMVGFFQVSQILEFFEREGEGNEERVTEVLEKLRKAGAEIDEEQGALSKVARSWNNPGYVLQKAKRKLLVSDELMREEWKGLEVKTAPEGRMLRDGYKFMTARDHHGEVVAQVVVGDPSKGARIDYAVQVGGGLTEEEVQGRYEKGRVVAEAVGAYTTGAQKPAELAFDNGHVQNLLISDREAVVIIRDGKMQIKHRDSIVHGDIDGTSDATPLQFSRKLADYSWLLKHAREKKLDLMAGHLLVDAGELAVGENSSQVRDKRRALATLKDGTFALVDFSQTVSLYEEAVILQKMGAVGAVNLDTGYYDHANVYTKSGERIMLGQQDQDGTNNKFVFLTP